MRTDFSTPEWVKDAVFYQIFPDRFAQSARVRKPPNLEAWDAPATERGFKGGDLLGVVEHLDYLVDLGITAIYLNPIFQSGVSHRYATYDYYHVDPLLGGNAALRELLDAAHRRSIRVILDGVFNHTGRGFFQFHNILENEGQSPYLDWFIVKDYPLNAYNGTANYQCWGGYPVVPSLNHKNPEVQEFILDVARHWIEEGIDGWRLDVPNCIDDDDFWQRFRQTVKAANPEAYIMGEIITDATRWLQGDQFDAVMNYLFTTTCLGFFGRDNAANVDMKKVSAPMSRTWQWLDTPGFVQKLESLLTMYPREAVLAQFNLLDSHDTPRFLSMVGSDKAIFRLALLLQMTYPGAPSLYAGDEIGVEAWYGWECLNAFPRDERRWDKDLHKFTKWCIAFRKAHAATRRGEYHSLLGANEVYAYLRRLNDDLVVVVINNSKTTYRLDIPVEGYLPEGARVHDALSGEHATVASGRMVGMSLRPRSGAVLTI